MKEKKGIQIDIDLVGVVLLMMWIYMEYMYLFKDGGDTSMIMGAIYFIGWLLYNPANDKILKTWSFSIGKKDKDEN